MKMAQGLPELLRLSVRTKVGMMQHEYGIAEMDTSVLKGIANSNLEEPDTVEDV